MTQVEELELDTIASMAERNASGTNYNQPKHGRDYIYWRMCPDETCERHTKQRNWIVIGPALNPRTAVIYTNFMTNKHALPLSKYGRHPAGTIDLPENRFGVLIERGGINEVPLEQAIELQWHRKPGLVKLMPALADVTQLPCEQGCPLQGSKARVFYTEDARQKHYRVRHPEVAATKAMGNEFSKLFDGIAGNSAGGGITAEQLEAILNATKPAPIAPGLTQEQITQFAVAFAKAMKEDEKVTK